MASQTTTLYIDDTGLRLLVARGKRITKLASVPLDSGLGTIDTPEKENELSEKIKQLFVSNKISNKKIILGLSGLRCLTRPVTLPELPKAMIEEAVYREARRVLPVPPEQLYISWQVVASSEGKLLVFMIAIPRQIADILMRVLHGAGLKPYLMDIKPVSLARLAREATSILIDIQPQEFDIVIMVGGLPQPIRTVSFPEDRLSLEEKASIVKAELERTIEFYNTNNPELKVPPSTPVLVSGELADEPELAHSLVTDLGFEIDTLQSPLKCPKHLDPIQHLMNVGLVLKESPKDTGPLLPNFNTLPEPYQQKQIPTNKLIAIPVAAAAVALVALLVMTIQDAASRLDETKVQLDATNLMIEKRQREQTELTGTIAELEQQLNTLQSSKNVYASAISDINKNGDGLNSDLNAVVGSLVANLDLSVMNHTPGSMAINGYTCSESEVVRYARQLFDTGRFDEVTIQSINQGDATSDNGTFSLNVRLKGAE